MSVTEAERQQLAREALAEVAKPGSVGGLIGETLEDGVHTLRFVSTLGGYPGWVWNVSLAELPDEPPTVLEAELMPGEGALVAPDWVPWSERLEEYRAAQAAAGEPDETLVPDADDDADDVDDEGDDSDDVIRADDERDGLDFEDDDDPDGELLAADLGSDPFAVGEDEEGEPEGEPDEDAPQPPAVTGLEDGAEEDQ